MSRWIAIGILLCSWQSALADGPWSFSTKLALTPEPADGVFHHLDGAGRKHIAVSANTVAVVWEDNHSGDPQIYVATKLVDQDHFSNSLQVSNGTEAYEPAVTALQQNRFVLVWEQDGGVFTSLLQGESLSEPKRLSDISNIASHASLAAFGQQVFAVWREQQGRSWQLLVARLEIIENRLRPVSVNPIEAQALSQAVLFPSIAAGSAGLCVAWEDRRMGHTRLLFSHSNDAIEFSQPAYLNEFFSNRNIYDKGNGVTRVSLNGFAGDQVLAAWMDKRRGGSGYGIYAALGDEGGESFGPNEKVHGEKGDKQPHYNPATAGNVAGAFAVAWDDFRSGDSDIWLSHYTEDYEWSEDFSPSPAFGPGEQTHPSLAMDAEGGLHLVWIERGDPLSATRLWYSYGKTNEAGSN
jgi:hypothetical protein